VKRDGGDPEGEAGDGAKGAPAGFAESAARVEDESQRPEKRGGREEDEVAGDLAPRVEGEQGAAGFGVEMRGPRGEEGVDGEEAGEIEGKKGIAGEHPRAERPECGEQERDGGEEEERAAWGAHEGEHAEAEERKGGAVFAGEGAGGSGEGGEGEPRGRVGFVPAEEAEEEAADGERGEGGFLADERSPREERRGRGEENGAAGGGLTAPRKGEAPDEFVQGEELEENGGRGPEGPGVAAAEIRPRVQARDAGRETLGPRIGRVTGGGARRIKVERAEADDLFGEPAPAEMHVGAGQRLGAEAPEDDEPKRGVKGRPPAESREGGEGVGILGRRRLCGFFGDAAGGDDPGRGGERDERGGERKERDGQAEDRKNDDARDEEGG
jgi:hypothetical protein